MTDPLSVRTHLEINPIPASTNKHAYACMYVSLYIMPCVEFIHYGHFKKIFIFFKVKKNNNVNNYIAISIYITLNKTAE